MRKITAAMYSWGAWKVREIDHNPYPDTNILYRRGVGGSTMPVRDKILCFDPNDTKQFINDIEGAWLKLSNRPQQCVYGKYVICQMIWEDGREVTTRDASRIIGVSYDTFNRNVSRGVQSIKTATEIDY